LAKATNIFAQGHKYFWPWAKTLKNVNRLAAFAAANLHHFFE